MFQSDIEDEKLFEAVRHLKYNKHEIGTYFMYMIKTEFDFDFD